MALVFCCMSPPSSWTSCENGHLPHDLPWPQTSSKSCRTYESSSAPLVAACDQLRRRVDFHPPGLRFGSRHRSLLLLIYLFFFWCFTAWALASWLWSGSTSEPKGPSCRCSQSGICSDVRLRLAVFNWKRRASSPARPLGRPRGSRYLSSVVCFFSVDWIWIEPAPDGDKRKKNKKASVSVKTLL